MLNVVEVWFECGWQDFTQPADGASSMRQALNAFYHEVETAKESAAVLRKLYEQQRAAWEGGARFVQANMELAPDPVSGAGGSAAAVAAAARHAERAAAAAAADADVVDVSWLFVHSPLEIARQMTLIDHAVFSRMQTVELFGERYKAVRSRVCEESIGAGHGPVELPVIMHAEASFHRLHDWVLTAVLQAPDAAARVAIADRCIQLCVRCKELGNFHATAAIAKALGEVKKLPLTWKGVKPESVGQLHSIDKLVVSSASGYAAHRAMLDRVRAGNGPSAGGGCCVPYPEALEDHVTALSDPALASYVSDEASASIALDFGKIREAWRFADAICAEVQFKRPPIL